MADRSLGGSADPFWTRAQAHVLPPLLRALGRLPARPAEALLALAGIAQGLLEPARLRRTWAWTAAQSPRVERRLALTLALLANRGRLLAFVTRPIRPEAPDARVTLEGREHLDRAIARGGTLLLSFHLGPGTTGGAIRRSGYRLTLAGSGTRFAWPIEGPAAWEIVWRDPATRAAGLFRLRRLLAAGELVAVTADALEGPELFRVPLPGRPLVVRPGWFVLRRLTGAPTLPVLTRLEGGRQVVTIHPPLPPPVPDEMADRAACGEVLTRLLSDYVRRFPSQCLSLAGWPEPGPGPAPER